jgi:hypothetical protein
LYSKMVDDSEDVLLVFCFSSVSTFSSSCFTYWMVLPRIEILSV